MSYTETDSMLTNPVDRETPDQGAFSHEQLEEMTELYRNEYSRLVGRAWKFNVSDPEGVVQQTFEKALKGWNKYHDQGDGRGRGPWLNTILTNTAISELRRANVHEGKDNLTSEFYDWNEVNADHGIDIQFENVNNPAYALHEHVKNLLDEKSKPEDWAKMFFLYSEGHTITEICAILDLPKGTVQSGMSRARKVLLEDERLRAAFGEFEDEFASSSIKQ